MSDRKSSGTGGVESNPVKKRLVGVRKRKTDRRSFACNLVASKMELVAANRRGSAAK